MQREIKDTEAMLLKWDKTGGEHILRQIIENQLAIMKHLSKSDIALLPEQVSDPGWVK